MRFAWLLGLLTPLAFVDATGQDVQPRDTSRLVVLGGNLTETVFALGLGDRVVGVDASSLYPPEAQERGQIGYHRAVSAEGVLSLKPTAVLALEDSGPPPALAQLEETGLDLVRFHSAHSPQDARQRIVEVAEVLDADASELLARYDADLAAVTPVEGAPRVLFIYARGGGVLNVAGTDTAADAMIRLAGGVNAVDGYSGYKPLTNEAAVMARPDIILVTTHGLDAAGGRDAVLSSPGVSLTPAGKAGRLVALDDLLLLGFGPRTPQGIQALADALREALA